MKKTIKESEVSSTKQMRPALTPEGRENQLAAMAYDLVEKRLREGTATSQETTHFLKMGSINSKLEREKLRLEIELTKAKTESIKNSGNTDQRVAEAMAAFSRYGGHRDESKDYE